MNIEIILDRLNLNIQQFQNEMEQIIMKKKSTTQKLRYLSVYLIQFKNQIIEWLSKIISDSSLVINLTKITRKLEQQKQQSQKQLKRQKLQLILRKKLNKLKKQSFLNSIETHSVNESFNDSHLQGLQKSVLLLQKDLNIQHDEDDQNTGHLFNLSSVIERSRMTLFTQTPIKVQKDHLNQSTISQDLDFGIHSILSSHHNNNLNQNILKGQMSFSNHNSSDSLPSTINKNDKVKSQSTVSKNSSFLMKNQFNVMQNQQLDSKLISRKQQGNIQKMIPIQKAMKKKKKQVFSNTGQRKQEMFGNLLEQSYQSFIQSSNK